MLYLAHTELQVLDVVPRAFDAAANGAQVFKNEIRGLLIRGYSGLLPDNSSRKWLILR